MYNTDDKEMIQVVDVNHDLRSLCLTDSTYISLNAPGNMINFKAFNDEAETSANTRYQLFDRIKDTRFKNPKSLIISHININSLKKEENAPIDYFKDILIKGFIDVLCVSETKLNDTVVDKDIDFSTNFKIYRQDRHTNSGGICTWIRSDIPHQRIPHLEIKSNVYHIENFIL